MNKDQEQTSSDKTEGQSVQLPMVLSHDHIPSAYVNVFQTRIIDGLLSLSCGLSYPDSATDANGQKQPVYAVELERRLMMNLDTAKRLVTVLSQTIEQATTRE